MEMAEHEAMADAADAMRKYRKENPDPPAVEYLTAGMMVDQAERELISEWLNELSIQARVTLAARLLNFSYEDLKPNSNEARRIKERLRSAADDCGVISARLSFLNRSPQLHLDTAG